MCFLSLLWFLALQLHLQVQLQIWCKEIDLCNKK